MRVFFALLLSMLASLEATGESILLPGINPLAYGSGKSVWSSEVRVTNLSSERKQFAVVDWIGSPGWRPKTWQIEPNQTLTISGYDVFRDATLSGPSNPINPPIVGAAIAEADHGLLVQIAVLTGIGPTGGVGEFVICEPWNGGYIGEGGLFGPCGEVGPCNTGAGPVYDASAPLPAGTSILLPWLHTSEDRRTNIVLINPDSGVATVLLTAYAADGTPEATHVITVGAHSLYQENDVFSNLLSSVRARNRSVLAVAARVVIESDTRLYTFATVISNLNNTVSLSLPRVLP